MNSMITDITMYSRMEPVSELNFENALFELSSVAAPGILAGANAPRIEYRMRTARKGSPREIPRRS